MSGLNQDDLQKEKEVAFYSALVSAWIETKMELDKTLVMLSAGGIGLLVTILTTVGVLQSWHLILYIGAFVSFLFSMVTALIIFNRNANLIEDLLNKNASKKIRLTKLDRVLRFSFLSGILFSISIGIVTAMTHFNL